MRQLSSIAKEIEATWIRKSGVSAVNYAARPYLDAMHTLGSINEPYFADSGASIVRYFLANAGAYRGDDARRIKAELRDMLATT